MEINEHTNKEYYTIDLLHIFKSLVNKLWVIILVSVLSGVIGFVTSAFLIAPKYSASIMLYVNNSSVSLGNASFSISSSEITAAQDLVKTYIVILDNRTTLEKVIDETKVSYDYKELSKMIEASAVNETEILCVKVTSENPYEAAKIANCIAVVLPNRISEIIEGASMEVVDSAVVSNQKVSPSITNYTTIAMVLGIIAATLIIALFAIMDDTIHDEEYILNNYNYPILAKVPNLLSTNSDNYKYYAYSRKF